MSSLISTTVQLATLKTDSARFPLNSSRPQALRIRRPVSPHGIFLRCNSQQFDRNSNSRASSGYRVPGSEPEALVSTLNLPNSSSSILGLEEEIDGRDENGANSDGKGGSVIGAVALITGTSVGAGILALPTSTAAAGVVPSAVVLGSVWLFLLLEALLIAEVNIALVNRRSSSFPTKANSTTTPSDGPASSVLSLRTMAQETLGPLGGAFSSMTYTFLSYTLLVAYIAKAGDVVNIATAGDVPAWIPGMAFSLGLGAFLYKGSTHSTDMLNRVLTAGLLALFGLIVFGGGFLADWSELAVSDWSAAPQMVPIVFLALVFHDLIPVLCSYLDGDLKRVRLAVTLGSAVPLLMFLSWDAVALCLSHGEVFEDPLETLMSAGGPLQCLVIQSFSFLAVSTSFIGTLLSMSEFAMEQIDHLAQAGRKALSASASTSASSASPLGSASFPSPLGSASFPDFAQLSSSLLSLVNRDTTRSAAFLFVLLPPVVVAISTPDIFYKASEFAGGYLMTTLYGIFPPLMYWSLRQGQAAEATTDEKEHAPTVVSLKVEEPAQPEKGDRKAGFTLRLPSWLSSSSSSSVTSWWDHPVGNVALAGLTLCSCGIIYGQVAFDSSAALSGTGSSQVVIAAADADLASSGDARSGTSVASVISSVPDTSPLVMG